MDEEAVMGEITIKKVEYKGWKNCIEITNGIIDPVATTDVSPTKGCGMNKWNTTHFLKN